MSSNEQNITNPVALAPIAAVVFAITTIAFGYLYFQEKGRAPANETQRVAVPVEVEKKVEVPAKLDDAQIQLMVFGNNYLAAFQQPILEKDKVFAGIQSFQVSVGINDDIEKIVSKETLQNKFELTLRKCGLKINNDSPFLVYLQIEGLKNDGNNQISYVVSSKLTETVVLPRAGEMRRCIVNSWSDGSFGYAGSGVVRDAIIRCAEEEAEAVANTYLKAQDNTGQKSAR